MPSPRKTTQRQRRDVRKSEAAPPTIEEESSPSRPAKRRKKAVEEEPLASDELVLKITQHLRVGDEPVQASKDHANSVHAANADGVQAYAKVAAQDWTYYITKLNVNIGRAPDHGAEKTGGRLQSHEDDDDDEDATHIDLGPSKVVSRNHARILYDRTEEVWKLFIKGRNGVKVDGITKKPAQSPHSLRSGEVLEIGGVEMMFVLPTDITVLHVDPKILERCGLATDEKPTDGPARQPLIAPTSSEPKRPGTPPPSTQLPSASTPALRTPAPVVVGADGVDLSHDDNQHIKPQFSYAQMITQAIVNCSDGKLNLSGIYDYIMGTYSYYRHQQQAGWQNSIRHNLSLNKSFEKVPRSTDEPGKGMKWQIVAEAKDDMVKNAWRIGRGGHRGSSVPSSPNQLNYITQGPREMASRATPGRRKRRGSLLTSPPQDTSNPFQSTPVRPPQRSVARNAVSTVDGSPLPRSKRKAASSIELPSIGNAPRSPTLTSSYYEGDGASFVTPAPPRVHPKLAPPSTAQRPSQHMPTSSPAPFWRYADIASTPLKSLRQHEASPSKVGSALPPASSSPPPAANNKSPPSSPTRPQTQGYRGAPPALLQEEEVEIDLTKGFQSIGTFHSLANSQQ